MPPEPLTARNVFLIGYRGTGKSTVAPLLAARWGWTAIDADIELEQRHGRTIRDIFASEGESAFRDKEAVILTELCALQRHVVATGGGVILREENRKRLVESGVVIWLRASPESIATRMQQDSTTSDRRPILTVGGLDEIRELLLVREPLYMECASFHIDTDSLPPERIAMEIDQRLRESTQH